MAVAGRKPKEDRSQVRHRVKPVHDWTEVQDKPYDGPRPELPPRTMVTDAGDVVELPWPERTKRWWETVSTMPHCVLWTEADWAFAVDTAEVHARFVDGKNATELRIRERRMGTTLDARRDLRIRYVDHAPVESTGGGGSPGVVNLDDYRHL